MSKGRRLKHHILLPSLDVSQVRKNKGSKCHGLSLRPEQIQRDVSEIEFYKNRSSYQRIEFQKVYIFTTVVDMKMVSNKQLLEFRRYILCLTANSIGIITNRIQTILQCSYKKLSVLKYVPLPIIMSGRNYFMTFPSRC